MAPLEPTRRPRRPRRVGRVEQGSRTLGQRAHKAEPTGYWSDKTRSGEVTSEWLTGCGISAEVRTAGTGVRTIRINGSRGLQPGGPCVCTSSLHVCASV